jgi:hypothetical protein
MGGKGTGAALEAASPVIALWMGTLPFNICGAGFWDSLFARPDTPALAPAPPRGMRDWLEEYAGCQRPPTASGGWGAPNGQGRFFAGVRFCSRLAAKCPARVLKTVQ